MDGDAAGTCKCNTRNAATKQRDYDSTILRLRKEDNTVCMHILSHVDASCTTRLHQHPDWVTWATPDLTTYTRSHTLLQMITAQFEKGDNTMLSYQFGQVVSARQGPDNPNTTAFPEYGRQLDSVISSLLDPTKEGTCAMQQRADAMHCWGNLAQYYLKWRSYSLTYVWLKMENRIQTLWRPIWMYVP